MDQDAVNKKNVKLIIIVAALGYFVDIYDLILFSVIRIKSLKGLGVPEGDLLDVGTMLINSQMFGMLIGGILWGVLGDKKGRLSVLFGSILLYSAANLANGFVTTVEQYAIIRFIAGIGLAGELGAGITLVTETMSKENRGYGTMIVAGVGLMGAVAAAIVGENYAWETSYIIGGIMGLLLLGMRVGLAESGMFKNLKNDGVSRGNIFMLFSDGKRFKKYLSCILIGIPLWFVVGVLVTFSPEFGKELNATEPLSAGTGIMYCYIGIAIGDIVAGFMSQMLRSRKKVMLVFLLLTGLSIVVYLNAEGMNSQQFIWLVLFLGFSSGYWATFVTIASEQFGTNLRATVTTTVPNFVRGSLVLATLSFTALKGSLGIINSALVVGFVSLVIALIALYQLKETFGKDLDYLEIS
ncbi:MAG: MFS transporter [Sphingobacteriales bacterium 17-39-43]|uniref:MFS transporter n=1 Tax=Daejeonella sp. TaxID=2805397 RepID=UPI000BCF2CCF|nr:MFS transporter [Daejeonella sp.]OYZ32882.1 MAG: MFS transporter [Sphingobacteriales bacterium 16-39-50]OZA26292.1 MAG: MFS transporter [Sphingobacteriales bacterium 17-39-43]HQT23537.1 MFS transporter [Daejeonella sp.]HQT56148.1 MFS transporter [Daejeonella sp.]